MSVIGSELKLLSSEENVCYVSLEVDSIQVGSRRRDINSDTVRNLAESISGVGLLNPITVDTEHNLIAGYHRLEAVKLLGWDRIDARIISVDSLLAELAEIDENLIRKELHYIDRGNQLLRRKEIYEELYPETRAGVAGGKASGATRGTNETDSFVQLPSFTEDVSRKTGVSRRTVEQDVQIAKKLAPEAQKLVKQHDMTKRDAVKLSRHEPCEQVAVVEAMLSNETSKANKKYLESDSKPHVSRNTGNNEWYTPAKYIKAVRAVMGEIELDPASNGIANQVVRANTHYTKDSDGLTKDWCGKVFMNPPYSSDLITLFCKKLVKHFECGDILEAIVLVNNATETGWFNVLIEKASAVIFTKGRVKYWMSSGDTGNPLQGQAFIYFGSNAKKFMQEFNRRGLFYWAMGCKACY